MDQGGAHNSQHNQFDQLVNNFLENEGDLKELEWLGQIARVAGNLSKSHYQRGDRGSVATQISVDYLEIIATSARVDQIVNCVLGEYKGGNLTLSQVRHVLKQVAKGLRYSDSRDWVESDRYVIR